MRKIEQTQKDNVVKLEAAPKMTSLVLAIDQLDSYHGRRVIARMLREWHLRQPRKLHTWVAFSTRIGITTKTISKFASEDTKAPQLHTVLRIMRGLGFSAVRFDTD